MNLEFICIGDKVISKGKIRKDIDKILKLRAKGCYKREIAGIKGMDRRFIKCVESNGEILKGKNIGLIGFLVENKEQTLGVCIKEESLIALL